MLTIPIQLAEISSAWLHILAEERGISVAALARELRTGRALGREIARSIVRTSIEAARYHVQTKTRPAPLTPESTLRDRVTMHYFVRFLSDQDDSL